MSIRVGFACQVPGELGNNELRYLSVPAECVNISYEINYQDSVALADDSFAWITDRQRAMQPPAHRGVVALALHCAPTVSVRFVIVVCEERLWAKLL